MEMLDREWLKFINEQIEIVYRASKVILEQIGDKGKNVDMRIDRELINFMANNMKVVLSILNFTKSMLDSRLGSMCSKDKS